MTKMRGFMLGLMLSVAFIVGCVANQYMQTQAHAQQAYSPAMATTQRWEQYCEMNPRQLGSPRGLEMFNKLLHNAGHRGFELTTTQGNMACFKRPVPMSSGEVEVSSHPL